MSEHDLNQQLDYADKCYEEEIKQACKEGWHKEKNMWAYVDCDCAHCKEARAEITKQMIEEFIEERKPTAMAAIAVLASLLQWLEEECIGCMDKGCTCGGYEENQRESADGYTFGDS